MNICFSCYYTYVISHTRLFEHVRCRVEATARERNRWSSSHDARCYGWGRYSVSRVRSRGLSRRRSPDGTRDGAEYHRVTVSEFTQQFHPDLPETTVWGFDGVVPGPIIEAQENQRLAVEFDNSQLPTEHLLSVDERLHGTSSEGYPGYDGPVPEVRTVTHFHGANIEPENDGQAAAWTSPDGVEGPGFVKPVHDVPNRQSRTSTTYHDHALGLSRLNVYAVLSGFYFIRSRSEERLGLPSGEYDIPLMLQDRTFEEDGAFHYPESFVPNVKGDTAVVNGAVWPYLEVEPRRYRL